MKTRTLLYTLVFTGLAFYGSLAAAQDTSDTGDDLDGVTMGVLNEGDAPNSLTEDISLPDTASTEGAEHSKEGLDTANEAREAASDEAGEDGSEAAAEASEHANDVSTDARDLVNDTQGSVSDAAQELSREAADQARGTGD